MKVINLFAGPGAGKSTTAAGVFSFLKQDGVSCELVTEVAKDMVWDKAFAVMQDQHLIFAKQRHRLIRLTGQVDYVVTDSPIILGNLYFSASPAFEQVMLEEMQAMENINFLLARVKLFSQVGRMQDEEGAKVIDEACHRLLTKYDLPYTLVEGGTQAGILRIVTEVLHGGCDKWQR